MNNLEAAKKSTIKTVKRIYRLGNLITSSTEIVALILTVCIDGVFNYTVTEALFTQTFEISVFTALMIGFAMNSMPLIVGAVCVKPKKTKLDNVLAISCLVILISMIVGMLFLRIDLIQEIFSESAQISTESDTNYLGGDDFVVTSGHIAMMVMLTVVTVATSAFMFALKVFKSTEQKIIEVQTLNEISVYYDSKELDVHTIELEAEKGRDRKPYNTAKLEEAKEIALAQIGRCNAIAAEEVAKKLGDSTSANRILG